MKRFQLMQKVNAEGLYGCVQACLPFFAENEWQGRIVVVCPPIYERFFRGKTAYAMGKVGMSVLVKGLVSTESESLYLPSCEQHDRSQNSASKSSSYSLSPFARLTLSPCRRWISKGRQRPGWL